MSTTLILCLCLATNVLSGSYATLNPTATTSDMVDNTHLHITTTPSEPFDEDAELAKIFRSCYSSWSDEQLSGYVVRPLMALSLRAVLVSESLTMIGLAELRATLNLAPLPPWQHFNNTYPTESDFESAPSIQAYYDLREPRSEVRSLDSDELYEKQMPVAIGYLDEIFPSIRKVYRHRFEKARQSYGQELDRKAIDEMLDEFRDAYYEVSSALVYFFQRIKTKCRVKTLE